MVDDKNQHKIVACIALSAAVLLSAHVVYGWVTLQPGSDIQLCTDSVDRPACYSIDYPTPTLNWTTSGASTQVSYSVQIDDDSNFNSPEIDTGWVVSTDEFFTVSGSGLAFETTYYWRMSIEDNFGSVIGDLNGDSFVTMAECLPEAIDMSVTALDYCTSPSHLFQWTYSDPNGLDQSRFHFQVDDNDNFNSPEVDRDYTGLSNPNLTVNSQTVVVVESPSPDQIRYDRTYYWRVKVWNSEDVESIWHEGSSFSTASHQYPTPSFSFLPEYPDSNEDVQFTDTSTAYGGGVNIVGWSWTFEDGVPASSSAQDPLVVFSSRGDKQITLQATDSDGYSCSLSGGFSTLTVGPPPTEWQETLPR